MKGFFIELAKMINKVFNNAGLKFVPEFLRYLLVALVLLSPVLAIIGMMCFADNDEPSPPAAKKVSEGKPVTPKKKREKIE